MDDNMNAQTEGKREIIESLDREFARLHVNSCSAVERLSADLLYTLPQPSTSVAAASSSSIHSVGESILRSAAVVERTFGGITANLWDDPFEWTLPEYLSTPQSIRAHLEEVEATRQRAFESFTEDDCLLKQIAIPSGEPQALVGLLLETLVRAVEMQSQALVVLKIFSGIGARRFII
jgi:hypothetical protein